MANDRDRSEQTGSEAGDDTAARRRFLGKVGKVAVTTSAVTLMLSAGAKRSIASAPSRVVFNEWH